MSKQKCIEKDTKNPVSANSCTEMAGNSKGSSHSSTKNSGGPVNKEFGEIKRDFHSSVKQDELVSISFSQKLLVSLPTIKEVMIDLPMPLGTFYSKTSILNHPTTVALFNSVIRAYDLKFCVLANSKFVVLAARNANETSDYVEICGVHYLLEDWFDDLVLMKQRSISGAQLASLNGRGLVVTKSLEVSV